MIKRLAASALVAAGFASAAAMAQEAPAEPGTITTPVTKPAPDKAAPPAEKASAPVTAAEKHFMETAARGNMEAIELARLAKEHAQSDDVKKLGQQLLDEHTKVGDDLKALAEKKGVELPKELPRADQSMEARLSKLSGAQFDKQYLTQMLSDHKKDISEFQHLATAAKDPDVKQFAQKTLPVLEEHERIVANLTREAAKEGGLAERAAHAGPAEHDHASEVRAGRIRRRPTSPKRRRWTPTRRARSPRPRSRTRRRAVNTRCPERPRIAGRTDAPARAGRQLRALGFCVVAARPWCRSARSLLDADLAEGVVVPALDGARERPHPSVGRSGEELDDASAECGVLGGIYALPLRGRAQRLGVGLPFEPRPAVR